MLSLEIPTGRGPVAYDTMYFGTYRFGVTVASLYPEDGGNRFF
jgi:hypothetical protein